MSNNVPTRKPVAANDVHAVRSLADEVDRLVAQSSLGTPEALDLRRETPQWLVRKIAERCEGDPADAEDDLAGIDYRDGGGLAGADLSGADLSEARLQKMDLSGTDLSGADLSGAQLEQADLSYANLEGAILVGASLDRVLLRGANLDGATLFRATMNGARVFDTSLRYTFLRNTALRGAIFGQTDLTGADLGKACLQHAVVAGVILAEADLTGATFHGTHVSHVDFTACVGLERRQMLTAQLEDNVVVPPGWPSLPRRAAARDRPPTPTASDDAVCGSRPCPLPFLRYLERRLEPCPVGADRLAAPPGDDGERTRLNEPSHAGRVQRRRHHCGGPRRTLATVSPAVVALAAVVLLFVGAGAGISMNVSASQQPPALSPPAVPGSGGVCEAGPCQDGSDSLHRTGHAQPNCTVQPPENAVPVDGHAPKLDRSCLTLRVVVDPQNAPPPELSPPEDAVPMGAYAIDESGCLTPSVDNDPQGAPPLELSPPEDEAPVEANPPELDRSCPPPPPEPPG